MFRGRAFVRTRVAGFVDDGDEAWPMTSKVFMYNRVRVGLFNTRFTVYTAHYFFKTAFFSWVRVFIIYYIHYRMVDHGGT